MNRQALQHAFRQMSAALIGLWAAASWAQPVAGEVKMVTGVGTASSTAGLIRKLERGSPVYPGDTISTAASSYVNVKFSDGGYVLVRPGSRFQVEAFDFTAAAPAAVPTATPAPTPAPTTAPTPRPRTAPPTAATAPVSTTVAAADNTPQRAFFRLLKGGFRAVTGAIGKLREEDYRITTPVATIGIRGTEPFVQLVEATSPMIDQLDLPEGVERGDGAVIGTFSGTVVLHTFARSAHTDIPTFTGQRWAVARWQGGTLDDAPPPSDGGTELGPNEFVWVDEFGNLVPIDPPNLALQTPDPTSAECN